MHNYFKSHSKIKEYTAAQGKVHSVAWNSDGRRLAAGSMDKTVTVFIMEGHRLVSALLAGYKLDLFLLPFSLNCCKRKPCFGTLTLFLNFQMWMNKSRCLPPSPAKNILTDHL